MCPALGARRAWDARNVIVVHQPGELFVLPSGKYS
jgi:hypothetical protein